MANEGVETTVEQAATVTSGDDGGFQDSFNEGAGVAKPAAIVETPVTETKSDGVKPQETVVKTETKGETNGSQVSTEGTITQDTTDYKALLEAEKQKTRSWEGRISAVERRNRELTTENETLKKGQKSTTQDTTVVTDGSLVDKDDPLIKKFTDEMGDDFIKPLDAYIKKRIDAAIKPLSAATEKVTTLEQQVTKIDEASASAHHAAILDAHKDVAEIIESGDLSKWVEEQPHKKALEYLQVMKSGSAKQVIDLLSTFKTATGRVKAEETTTGTQTETKTETKTETAPKVINTTTSEQVVAATAVKGGKATLPKGKADINDFAGGFTEALAESK